MLPRRGSGWGWTRRLAAIAASAERWLLDAARVDRQFEPRWTLANFYFRQQKTDRFWTWMRSALEVSYGEPRRGLRFVLQRRRRMRRTILARAIPERHDALAAFVAYQVGSSGAMRRRPLNAIRLVAMARTSRTWPALLDTELDALLAAGRRTRRAKSGRTWVSPRPRERAIRVSIPTSSPPRLGHGFDWRLIREPRRHAFYALRHARRRFGFR